MNILPAELQPQALTFFLHTTDLVDLSTPLTGEFLALFTASTVKPSVLVYP